MIYKFKTKYERHLEIDLTKWKIDEDNRRYKIIEVAEGDFLLENIHQDRFSVSEHIIKA
jgi:hypothetical protein